MFRFMYGYAFGAKENKENEKVDCTTSRDCGVCHFGNKHDHHQDVLSGRSLGDFEAWIATKLSELAILHAACLPIVKDTCTSHCSRYEVSMVRG